MKSAKERQLINWMLMKGFRQLEEKLFVLTILENDYWILKPELNWTRKAKYCEIFNT